MKLNDAQQYCSKILILSLFFGFFLVGFSSLKTHAIGTISRGIVVTNNLSAQTNYPVEVVLNTSNEITAGRMRSDCGDIRVLASNISTNLTYAFLNCNTTYTSVVAIIPTLPVGDTTIYITFGDSALTTTQAPLSVFDKYEMFTAAPACTLSGTAAWDSVNNWLLLTPNANATNIGRCNYAGFIPGGALTNKGYKAWYDTFTGTVGSATGGQSIWQYAFSNTVTPTGEDTSVGGAHFNIDENNNRICYRGQAAGCTGTATYATTNAAIANGVWRSVKTSYDTTTKELFENGTRRFSTTNGTTPVLTNTNFGFASRTTSGTRYREHRVRNFAMIKYSELITAQFVDSASFVIRNSADTADFANNCDFGDLSVSLVGSCQYRLKYTTSSGNGYSFQVQTTGSLIDGSQTIANATAGTGGAGGTLISAGTENYGVTITTGSCTRGTTTTTNAFNPAAGNSVLFNYTTPTTVASCNGQNQTGATDLVNTILVDQKIAISGNTPAGIYTQTVTWTAVPSF
jgi:hypothetical protein